MMFARLVVLVALIVRSSHALVAWVLPTLGPCAADMTGITCLCFNTIPESDQLRVTIGSTVVMTPPRKAVVLQRGHPMNVSVSAFLNDSWTPGVAVSLATPFIDIPPPGLRIEGSGMQAPYQTVRVVYDAKMLKKKLKKLKKLKNVEKR